MADLTIGRISALVGGELRGDGERLIRSVAPLEGARGDALAFIASARYLPYLQATRAGGVLLREEWAGSVPEGCAAIVVQDPHQAIFQVLTALHPPARPAPGVHPTAVVDPTARLGEGVSVGPFAVLERDTVIGAGSIVGAHSLVGEGCRLGSDVTIHSHATLYREVVVGDRTIVHSGARVGKEGFGYVWREGGHRKIPQVGGCILEEDVEVGTNVTIDRGSIGDTVVGAGTKIDNLVHLGHNVKIGKHVLLLAQVAISGSTVVGDGAVLAGQVGVVGHITIGPGARIGAQGGVTADVPPGETYSGYPARPHREALRAQAGTFRFPELMRRLKKLEEMILGRNDDRVATESGEGAAREK
jgi:UDP-3-O-[3-hydroxymyristoyl] glucosamine N-acyltransferase